MTWRPFNRGIPFSTAVRALAIAPSILTATRSGQGRPGLSGKEDNFSEQANVQEPGKQALAASTARQQGSVVPGLIKSGIIVDSFEPDTDSFSIILSPCAGLSSAIEDMSNKTVYVEVGPFFSGYLPGNLFAEKGGGFFYRFKGQAKVAFLHTPHQSFAARFQTVLLSVLLRP